MHLFLKLHGISWLFRQTIILATISQHTSHAEVNGLTRIIIQNVGNGGFKGTTEVRNLNWQLEDHRDYILGHLRGRSGYKRTQEAGDEGLRTGWLEETLLGECIQNDVAAADGSWQSSSVRRNSFRPYQS